MTPEYLPEEDKAAFLRGITVEQGVEVSGKAFLLNLADGGEHIVVFADDGRIISSEPVISGFKKLVAGFGIFKKSGSSENQKANEIPPYAGRPDATVHEVFDSYGGARLPNQLARAGITTFQELADYINSKEDWEEEILAIRNVGAVGLAIVKARLGRS